jgi:hypothetical protein
MVPNTGRNFTHCRIRHLPLRNSCTNKVIDLGRVLVKDIGRNGIWYVLLISAAHLRSSSHLHVSRQPDTPIQTISLVCGQLYVITPTQYLLRIWCYQYKEHSKQCFGPSNVLLRYHHKLPVFIFVRSSPSNTLCKSL